MSTTGTQNDRVLARLRRGPLTSMQAFRELGCTRLSARIWDLRRQGYDISSPVKTSGKAHFAEYRLNEKKRRAR